MIYLIGSLKHDTVRRAADFLRDHGFEVFDDWHACGTDADAHWQAYETERGRTYPEALMGKFAQHGFGFDKDHLDQCTAAVLVMPAGKSGHLELGYVRGLGKPGFVLFDGEWPQSWDLMYLLATGMATDLVELSDMMKRHLGNPLTAVTDYIRSRTW